MCQRNSRIQPTKLNPLQVSDACLGVDPVSIVSHSRVHSWFIWLATFISPAHYSHKIPDSSGVCVHQWPTRVTLRRKMSTGRNKINSVHLTNAASLTDRWLSLDHSYNSTSTRFTDKTEADSLCLIQCLPLHTLTPVFSHMCVRYKPQALKCRLEPMSHEARYLHLSRYCTP